MILNKQTEVKKDLANKRLIVEREFDAPLENVWRAWTESELLDKWWAPKPWKAETKTMDFREGGHWLYCMVGPEGPGHWCRADFKTIDKHKSFRAADYFCDEKGNLNNEFPTMNWYVVFGKTLSGSKVEVEIKFESEADLEKILELGFEEGFLAALGNLDELLEK